MKKTISINISGMVFNIEEDAFARLNSYLDGLKGHFGSAEYGKEVVSDIENRIAEQFDSKLKDRKTEVMTITEVEEVIKNMGTAQDMSEGSPSAKEEKGARKRLYRNPDDQIVGGVASGIASYFNIDPIIPRILFAVLLFAGGWGFLLYIVLWIVVPEAQTASEKLEMKGTPVTVANLEESRKGRDKQRFSVVSYFFREVFYLIGRFFRALGPVLGTIIGLVVTAVSFVSFFAVTLLASVLFFNPDAPYVDPAIAEVFNGNNYQLLVASGYVTALIPILLLLVTGISMVRRRNSLGMTAFLTMLGIWMVGGVVVGYMLTTSAPQIEAAVKSIEKQPEVSKPFDLPAFNAIESTQDQQITVTYGTQQKVTIYGREQEVEKAELFVNEGVLSVRTRDEFRICIICIDRPLKVEVIIPELTSVQAYNASDVNIQGFNGLKSLQLSGRGASEIVFSGKVETLLLDLANASDATLSGTAKNLNAELFNASELVAKNLVAETAEVGAANASEAELNVTKRIEATASGASHIRYTGNPPEEVIDESNASRITEF